MTTGLRRRILILQVGLLGIFGFAAGFLFWTSSFIGGQVHDQLAQQQIFFPAAGSKGLDAATYPTLQQYGGQQLLTGDQAKAYANDFIGHHLDAVAGGKTYSQVSAIAQANPKDTVVAAQVQTLFRGETLRGLLLNAYGWGTIGVYALYAGIGLAVATFAVLLALIFELVVAPRSAREKVKALKPSPMTAPVATA
jgi:hypothetical protein